MTDSPDSHTRLLLELLRLRTKTKLASELSSNSDELQALRKALLGLILMVQGDTGPAASEFIQYLIADFEPLRRHLGPDGTHPLLKKTNISAGYSAEEHAYRLAFNQQVFNTMLSRKISKAEITKLASLLPWDLTANRFIGFYDIMGFKELVERSSSNHDVIHAAMTDLHAIKTHAETIFPDGVHPGLKHPGSLVRMIQFSDTILAITRDASSDCSLVIQLVSNILFINALRIGVLIRGAMAFGTVTADFDRAIYLGQPIVDAYLLEQDQAWYGVAEHSSCQSGLLEATDGQNAPQLGDDYITLVADYPVPLKSGAATRMGAINWPMFLHDAEEIKSLLSKHEHPESQKLNGYYGSTLDFAHKMRLRLTR